MFHEKMSKYQLDKLETEKRKMKRECPLCGHKIPIRMKETKSLCRYCGVMVYRDEKSKFIDIMKKKLGVK